MAGKRPAGVYVDDRGTRRALGRMGDGLDELPDTAGVPAAELVAHDARSRVPVVSGDLRNSIGVELNGPVATVTAGDADTPYAGVIEYGWRARNIAAQPYLRDALIGSDTAIVDIYGGKVDDLIRRFDRETPP